MILGAGLYQVPLIRKAKAMGLRVIAVSIEGNYPGFAEADESVFLDVRDAEAVYAEARRRQIDAIVTNQTDLPVTTVAYVAEKLGLPGIGLECAARFTNKYLMRQVAERCGCALIRFEKATSTEFALAAAQMMRYPLIVKPISNQGSRGVSKVATEDKLAAAVHSAQGYSASGEVIVEEYFDGRELIMDGLMTEEGFQTLPIGDVEMADEEGLFVSRSVIYPSTLDSKLQNKVRSLNERIVREMRLPFGLTHSEFRVCEQSGRVALMETAARGGGTYISSDLVPLACGLDVEEILLRQVLGFPVPEPWQTFVRASAYVCVSSLPAGVLREIKGLSTAERLSGVHRVVLQKKVGDTVGPMIDKTTRWAIFLLKGENRDEIVATRKQLEKAVSFIVDTPNGHVEVGI